jgi:hypothetical protein
MMLALSCSPRPRDATPAAWLVVQIPAGANIDLARAAVSGPVRGTTVSGSKLVLEIDTRRTGGVTVDANGACRLALPREAFSAGATVHETLKPLLDFGRARAALGFGAPLVVDVVPGCPEATPRTVAWKQTAGAQLEGVRVERGGLRFSARMPRFVSAFGGPPPWGVVPLSPRTRGAVTLEATAEFADGRQTKQIVQASAAARSHGLPNVGLGSAVYLGGDGWRVASAPPDARATVTASDGIASLDPDVAGTWTLIDGTGKSLRLAAGRYDATPLDCGRSDCHAAIAEISHASPMSTVLQRGLTAPFQGDYPACALGCHAIGEPGLSDGGFVDVMEQLGRTPQDVAHTGWHDLPVALRRLGGVGCLGCHGPGAIPEPSARHGILRADVCATCHDAPPTYGHVAAWRESRMARADADPRTQSDAFCARCHTTWGFLGQPERRPPPDAAPAGIACAACHAVHPAEAQADGAIGRQCAEALRREVGVPALLGGALPASADKSRICLSCHTPEGEALASSAATVWLGRGGLDPETGAPLTGAAPHGAIAGGCVGCHRAGPDDVGHGAGHAFRADASTCKTCHGDKPSTDVRERALRLLRTFASNMATSVAGSEPPHATRPRFDRGTPQGRAAWNLTLVLEDPAAAVHNGPYARLLVDASERSLAREKLQRGAP